MKKFLIVLGVIVVLLVSIIVFKNPIIKSVVTTAASRITGVPVHMDGFSFSILKSSIRISGLKIYNPSGFPKGILVSCSKINVIYDRAALFKQKLHLVLVEVELDEMGLMKNKEGELNVDSLKVVQAPKPSKPMPMRIDLLTLGIGKIVYKDYSVGTEPAVRVQDVNIHKSYKGITSAQQLAVLILVEPVKAAGIKAAKIYGLVMLSGVAALPVGIAATFLGKDSVQQTTDASFQHVYEVSLEVVKRIGKLTKEDAANGAIKANIQGAMVAIQLRRESDNKTEITISARKYVFPKPDIAGGVLYQIVDKL
ncbi:MAG: DUF3568 domain-containing protein [Candidatus Omnitrophica bacterium]|nr:DUF3568 domain-containing protein [Candidatus Omnitrophota bacterium]